MSGTIPPTKVLPFERFWRPLAACFISLFLALILCGGLSPQKAQMAGDSHSASSFQHNGQYQPQAGGSILFTDIWLAGHYDFTKSLAWGDMDGDGDLDLVLGNYGDVIRLYRNDGGGSFVELPAAFGAAAWSTESVAWGDMDGDGDLDLAVGNDSQVNCLYRNDGAGIFTSIPNAFGVAVHVTASVAWGDYDSDGHLDLAVGNRSAANQIFHNNGAGSFSEVSGALGGAAEDTQSIAWGDMDGDGDLDLAVGNYGAVNRLYRNDGGAFTDVSGALGYTAYNTTSLAWGDLDGDGDLDLVVGNDFGSSLVFRNQGGGSFSLASGVLDTYSYFTKEVAIGDADGDGDLDLAFAMTGINLLYQNNGLGTFGLVPEALGTSSPGTYSLAWGDMDGDGDLDLALGNYSNDRIFRNDGQASLSEVPGAVGNTGDTTFSLAWGDMEGDGDLDLAIGNYSLPDRIFRNDGAGRLTNLPGVLGGQSDWTTSLAWGDFDGDRDLDLAVGISNAPNRLYRNAGGGVFTEISGALGGFADATSSLAWGDMDGDGDLDLAVGNENETDRLYRNDGPLSGGGWKFTEIPGALDIGVYRTYDLAWGDADSDGDLDLAVGKFERANRLYRNDGLGNFSVVPDALGDEPLNTASLAWGDMDGDGDLDLAIGTFRGGNRLYRNDGVGYFSELPHVLGGEADPTYAIAWGDLDGDGDLDLAAGNGYQVSRLYRNDGQGNFSPVPGILGSADEGTSSLAWGDYDGDGDLDLVLGNTTSSVPQAARLYRSLRQHPAAALPENPAFLAVRQPAGLPAAGFYAISGSLTSQYIPVTYTLYDPEGSPLHLLAQYSLDGGGQWLTATGSALGSAAGIWDSFDPIVGTQWRLLSGGVVTGSLCGGEAGSQGLNFNGSYGTTRQAVTRPLDLSQGGQLSFSLRIGTGVAPCENADNGENVILEYSLNGTPWATIATYNQDAYPTFTPISLSIPAAARSPATRLRWRQITHSGTGSDNWALDNVQVEIKQTFIWDTFASNFFGQSNNVVLRFEAIPVRAAGVAGTYHYLNATAGSFQQTFASASTYPFPARGTQVRVLQGGQPKQRAQVFRIPQGQTLGTPMSAPGGSPYLTDAQGYLQGRGALAFGDRLVALLPVRATEHYTLYYTSAAPNAAGLAAHTVSTPGVQILNVSSSYPLLLFNLDISLEWDARSDGLFLEELAAAIQQASAVLYDITNGQAAIGEVRLYMDRQGWETADVAFYAQTGIRPRATMGGVTDALTDDVDLDGHLIPAAYGPGQVRIGPNWDPFGSNLAELTPDWQRALAHELAHYLFYLPDNYLGVDPLGQPVSTDCRGSFMTNTYDDSYSEFLRLSGWTGNCLETIAEHTTGRYDWQTVRKFYPDLLMPSSENSGPSTQPLVTTNVQVIDPGGSTNTLPPRYFDVRDANAADALIALPRARVYLFKTHSTSTTLDDRLIPLGATVGGGDRIKVRGAALNDRLCLISPYDLASGRAYLGCISALTASSASIPVRPVTGWQPAVLARSVTSTTLQITLTLASAPPSTPWVQVLPAYGGTAPSAQMVPAGSNRYVKTLSLAGPAFEGWIRVYVVGSSPPLESLSQYFLSPPWGPNRGSVGMETDQRAWGANSRLLGAPAASGDGQVTVFNLLDFFADTGTVSLQALNDLPGLPSWLTMVGQAYRFTADRSVPRSLAYDYLQRETPPGYEHTLNLYYSPDDGHTWQRLDTQLDTVRNRATASMPQNAALGQGVYVLAAAVEMPALSQGWNLFAYPIPEARPAGEALQSIDGAFTSVAYHAADGWRLYDAPLLREHPGFAPLVNTLDSLEFGRSYWLYATRVITPYLGVPGGGALAATTGELELPPATYYGPVQPGDGFQPAVGMPVTAWVGGVLCGSSSLVAPAGELIYAIQVAADTGNGCGAASRPVVFRVGGTLLPAFSPVWDNRQAWYYPLGAVQSIYLPVVTR